MAIQLADLPLHMRRLIEAQHGIVLQGTPNKWKSGRRADLGIFVRSASEANIARYLKFMKARGLIVDWQYEPRRFDFPIRRGTTSYLPDFRVEMPDGSIHWWEIKGWRHQRGETALKRMAKYYPDEKVVLINTVRYKEIARQVAGCIPYWE